MGFVDLHSHVLPGLDDGSPDVVTSMAMLKGLAAIGFDRVCATPHQKSGQFMPSLPAIRDAWTSTAQALADEAVDLALSLAAENMWDSTLAFLFELPLAPQLPLGLFEQLFVLRAKGRLPALAHPERYEALWSSPDLLERLRDSCALVVDLGAVAGYHGKTRAKFARKWIREGLVHAVASDAHTPDDVRVAAEGIAWIRDKVGRDVAQRLLDVAPRKILAGRHPAE
jgi:protein-tyrosine phosphatase